MPVGPVITRGVLTAEMRDECAPYGAPTGPLGPIRGTVAPQLLAGWVPKKRG